MKKTAIIVDDIASDRQLVARILQRSGWKTYTESNTLDANRQIKSVLSEPDAVNTVIITDLDMPGDPANGSDDDFTPAGINFALYLRTKMEEGELLRVPIIALTALTERELHLTARAFGCDIVLAKPATINLSERIEQEWQRVQTEEALGNTVMLKLLRTRLARSLGIIETTNINLTEQDITKALLVFRRSGMVGLGESVLGYAIAPNIKSSLQRGEKTYNSLLHYARELMNLGVNDVSQILIGELVNQATPAEQSTELGISISEFYRRRREAIAVLLNMLANRPGNNPHTF